MRGWVFDLTHAELLDSTNLGLLARLAARAGEAEPARSIIVSPSDDINSVLRSMSFDQLFDIVTVAPPDETVRADGEDIAGPAASRRELGETMLDAHRALIALSDSGRLEFEQVVAALEAELSGDDA